MAKKNLKRPKADRVIEGRNPVLEALSSEADLDQLWVAQGLVENEKIKTILRLAAKQQIPVRRIKRKVLDRVSATHRPQGVIAFGSSLPEFSLVQLLERGAEERNACFLVLTEILEEQNLGAILRTAEAAGVQGVVIPKRAKGITPVVTRTAMGAAEHLPVVKENIFSALKTFRNQGIKIVGAASRTGQNLYQVDLRGPIAFVVGGEDKGMTTPVKKDCDLLVSIPIQGQASSLNIGVAWAVLVYEKLRQETVKNKS